MKLKENCLALFDFDGTITKKDSLIEFIKFSVGINRFLTGLLILSPTLILFKLGILSNSKAKEKVIAYFYSGMDENKFKSLASNFATNNIKHLIKKSAECKLDWHQQQQHKIVLVTASIENWLLDWCNKMDYDLIATKLEFKDGKVTGKFAIPNCHGKEKINRIKNQYNLDEFDYIYAYGDSKSDKYMLSLANEQFYKKL